MSGPGSFQRMTVLEMIDEEDCNLTTRPPAVQYLTVDGGGEGKSHVNERLRASTVRKEITDVACVRPTTSLNGCCGICWQANQNQTSVNHE